MNVLIVSKLKKTDLRPDCKGVPRVGDSIYHYGTCLVVRDVMWWPTKDALAEFDVTWCGFHVSELACSASVEAIVVVD